MTRTPLSLRLTSAAARLLRGRAGSARTRPGWVRPTRRRAARVVAAFAVSFAALHVGFAVWLDYGPPQLRDPEYGKRLSNLRTRVAENPGRPLVLVIGSSRVAMGVRPGVLGPDPGQPLLFNFALAGSGPIMELMAFRRAVADGVKPAAVLVEYWPAFLFEEAGYHEDARIDVGRLRPVDRRLVREYFRRAPMIEAEMAARRRSPWYSHRRLLMNLAAPSWLPNERRTEAIFARIDDWGWLPGRESATPDEVRRGRAVVAGYYKPLFAQYVVSPVADRAVRQLVAECRAAGLPVALVYLPETAWFRALSPPAAVALADDNLARLRAELDLPLIDGRGWLPDDDLPDGFHPTQAGAVVLTRKLLPAVTQTFPELKPAAGAE